MSPVRALCRGCGKRLILAYPEQERHPSCDDGPDWWTDAELDRYQPSPKESA